MITEPRIEERDELNYVAIRTVVSMDEIAKVLPPLIPEVYNWLSEQEQAPAGPLFFRYLRLDEGRRLDVEVAVPVRNPLQADGRVESGRLPAGRYAVARHQGSYDGLRDAWPAFERWCTREGLQEAEDVLPDGTVRGTRAEHYLKGPADLPDPEQWETELVLQVREGTSR